jgi:hypothetical protein
MVAHGDGLLGGVIDVDTPPQAGLDDNADQPLLL